ncbi:MAG: hypothetical protein ABS897_09630 [Eubacteriales bacterium]
MKKLSAVLLALMLALTCLPAIAEEPAAVTAQVPAAAATYQVKLSADKETAKNVLPLFGLAESQAGMIDPIVDLINALAVDVIIADGGVQVDLSLNGGSALSLGGTATEDGLVIASSLFPNYILTFSQESLQGMIQQYVPMAAGGQGEAGGMDMNAMGEAVGKYIAEFMAAFETAVKPGEAEQGTFEAEGITFDLRTPMDVDEAALAEAAKKLVSDLMNDEAVTGMLASVPNFSPEELLKSVEEMLSEEHLPDVAVDVYSDSANQEIYCTVSEATYKEAESPAYRFTMLNQGASGMKMDFLDLNSGMTVGMEYSTAGLFMSFDQGGMYFAVRIGTGENGEAVIDLFAVEKEKPLLTLSIAYIPEGARTLSLDTEGKTILAIEDMQGESGQQAMAGLTQEAQVNLMQLMALPEVSGLMKVLTQPQTQVTETPEQPVADPSAWKTLGDVMALDLGENQSGWGDGQFAMEFEYGGKYWLVKALVPEEALEAYQAVDFFDEERDAKQIAAIGGCAIESVTDLETLAIPQEELDRWIGKSGQDMLDAGWEQNGYEDTGKGLFIHMINGAFQYNVSFGDAVATPEWGEKPDYAGAQIVSVTFGGPSYSFSLTD